MNILKKSTSKEIPKSRNLELRAMIFVAIVLLFGLFFVYLVKTMRPQAFAELPVKMTVDENSENKFPEIVNLNELKEKKALLNYLKRFENEADRNFAADKLLQEITDNNGNISTVGFLSSIRVTEKEINEAKDIEYFKTALNDAQDRAENRIKPSIFSINGIRDILSPREDTIRIRILSNLGSLKSSFIVRTPSQFFYSFLIWSSIFFIAFFGLHLFWRFRRFEGDGLILPPIFLLCGIGFLMMTSMRDPLRDSLMFADFATGVMLGCISVAVITSIDYQNLSLRFQQSFPKYADHFITYTPIAIAVLLSLALIFFGTTPGTSDAKINLNIGIKSFQPSEVIKILFALFVAFYFGERWEYFRYLEKKLLMISFPRFKDVFLVSIFVVALIMLFFFQKDLGPALMMAGLFLILFAVVRKRIGLSITGFLAVIAAYAINYLGYLKPLNLYSQTAANRLDIWRNPWDTMVSGGDQIVHSLWSFATGGISGTGIGLGDPYFAPAHHTDLILSSVGEELGFVGILLIFSAYALLFYRCFVIAKNAFSPFAYFLVLGLSVINALQFLFISAGVLGLIPLSGVVTPFLSDGMSSMICNFAAFGMVLAVSSEKGSPPKDLTAPTKYIAYGFIVIAVIILIKAFSVQVWKSNEILVKGVLSPVGNELIAGVETSEIRRYGYNPRIRLARKELPFGTIYDRNGIPLASSNWEELNKFAEEYEKLGVMVKDVCKKGVRCYPFGNKTFHLIGNANSEKNWAASNTNYVEKDYQNILRGYNDFAQVQKIEVSQMLPKRDEQGVIEIDEKTKEPILVKTGGINLSIEKKDYRELLPLIHNRYNPINISANLLKFKDRIIKTSIDIRLQISLTDILKTELDARKLQKGAVVILEPKTGDLLASVSLPIPEDEASIDEDENNKNDKVVAENNSLLDRARFGVYPPGSTFKIVTGMAAFRKDKDAANKSFSCINLPGGRVGFTVRGRAIKDDINDKLAHGNVTFSNGLRDSCNAYFAQLGNEISGAEELYKTAEFFNIETANVTDVKNPSTYRKVQELNKYLPQSSFGQGEVVASPFQIAKVSATVANGGLMQTGRWITDENNLRKDEAVQIISTEQNSIIAEAMRRVVTNGTATSLLSNHVEIAGKTGTAENSFGKSHSWFTGFAPYNTSNNRIAFAVVIENGGYGGGISAKVADALVRSAKEIGVIE